MIHVTIEHLTWSLVMATLELGAFLLLKTSTKMYVYENVYMVYIISYFSFNQNYLLCKNHIECKCLFILFNLYCLLQTL